MSTAQQRDRCRERLERLCRSSLDGDALQRETIAALQKVVGFDRWCWPLGDPETLLPGSGIADHDYGPGLPRALELEYTGPDFATKDTIARRPRPVGSLSTDTRGDLARSSRWDEVLRPVGIGDIATVACRDAFGCWGWVEAYRNSADRPFSDEDLSLLADVGPALGHALRRRVGPDGDPGPDGDLPAGIVVLDHDLRALSHTAAARVWMDQLPAAGLFAMWGILPAPIYPVATLAREGRTRRAHSLLPAENGRWLRIEAAGLDGGYGEVAVTVRAATAAEMLDIHCRARGLSRRERELVMLLVDGLDTTAVARRMGITTNTVQDHLKSVFAKVHVHSRRELVATLNGHGGSPAVPDARSAGRAY